MSEFKFTDGLDTIQIQRLSKDQGFGYYLARPGEILHDKYEVKKLIGVGTASSVFLCKIITEPKTEYVAVKILTADATDGNTQGVLQEAQIMRALTKNTDNWTLTTLDDTFEIDGPHGHHICLVMPPLSPDLNKFRTTAPQMALPVYTVKTVINEILEGLKVLHEAGIIHTDVKADNVFFDGPRTDTIETDLIDNPPIIESEIELNGLTYPVMRPQRLPFPYKWNDEHYLVEMYGVYLADFSHAIWADKERKMTVVGPESLRAPEVILQAGYGPEIDIWAIGCTVFEMLTGRWLLKPDLEEGDPWTAEDDLLAKMMELTGERFSDTPLLSRAERYKEFFDDKGNLLRISTLVPVSFENALKNYQTLTDKEAAEAAQFISDCLRLDPARRWTAERLLVHPWMDRGPPPSCNGAVFA